MKETFELLIWAAICNSLLILGIYAIFSKGMIFGFVSDWLETKPPIYHKIAKPIIWCVTCMSSVWGSVFYLFVLQNQVSFGWYVPYIVMVAGLNFVISHLWYE